MPRLAIDAQVAKIDGQFPVSLEYKQRKVSLRVGGLQFVRHRSVSDLHCAAHFKLLLLGCVRSRGYQRTES